MILDAPMRRPAGVSHPVIWTLCAFILAMLAWSFAGHLDVVTTARGRVINEGQIKSVQAAVSSSVRAIHAKDGDSVRAGDVLLELDDAVFQADVASVKERIAQLQTELSRLEAEASGRSEFARQADSGARDDRYAIQRAVQATRQMSLQQRKQEARATVEARRSALASGEFALQGQEARLLIAKEKEQRARPYVDLAMPRFQYLQLKDDVLTLERDIAVQRVTNERLAHELSEAGQRLLQITSVHKQDIAQAISDKRSALVQLYAELSKADKRLSDTRVSAPQDGIVQRVMVTTVGASVTPNDVLLQIVPANARLLIDVLVPNEEKGYLQAGQLVDIKLDAFPFQKFGRLEGRLEWISPDAELSTASNISLLTEAAQIRALTTSVPQYVYRGHVVARPESNQRLRLAPGMTAHVDIYTDRRRIIDFFLFPLERVTDEAMRVR
jgi:hemolysin D